MVDGPTGGASPLWAILNVVKPGRIDHRGLRRRGGLCVGKRPSEAAPGSAKNPVFRDVN